MKIVKKCMLLGLAVVATGNVASARLRTKSFPSRSSEMMVIENFTEEDPAPFEVSYQKEIERLNKEIEKLNIYEETAQGYLYRQYSSIDRSSFGSIMKAAKKVNSVETPIQKEFMAMILERMRKTSNEKAIKDVEKQLAKGKVSDKARSEISEFYRTNRQKVVAIEDSISRLEALKKKEGVIACMRKSFPEKSKTIPVRMLTFTDTILNTSWRPAIFLKSSEVASDFSDASKGWEWLKQESSQYKDESYPVDVSYYYYPSHPEFKVKEEHSWRDPEYVVYDAKGSLVAIPMFRRGVLRMAVEPLKLKIQAYAYNNNDLNIQSDDAHAKHYVKVQTGLEKLTAKEKQASERAQTQLANAILGSMRADMKYGSNSRKAKAIGRKNAGKAVAALGSSDFYDDKGYRWLDEIEKIYDAKLASPYSFERVDDTTFRSIYVDRNGNGLFEVIVKYVTDGEPFTYKEQFTVNSLAGQHFFTSEEVGQYNDLISRCGSAKNASEIN